MNPIVYPGMVTALAVLLYTLFTMNAGRNRGKHNILAPATSGHEAYERAYRVQMNTLAAILQSGSAFWLLLGGLYGFTLLMLAG